MSYVSILILVGVILFSVWILKQIHSLYQAILSLSTSYELERHELTQIVEQGKQEVDEHIKTRIEQLSVFYSNRQKLIDQNEALRNQVARLKRKARNANPS
jgi:dsDNA-specific endonuclease/ATPase MutS2